jgi:hypothetical protein
MFVSWRAALVVRAEETHKNDIYRGFKAALGKICTNQEQSMQLLIK